MSPTYHAQLRTILRAHPDGLSTVVLGEMLNKDPRAVQKALQRMPDAYLDRWGEKNRQYAAIWCVVKVPENCPHPLRDKPGEVAIETTWRTK